MTSEHATCQMRRCTNDPTAMSPHVDDPEMVVCSFHYRTNLVLRHLACGILASLLLVVNVALIWDVVGEMPHYILIH